MEVYNPRPYVCGDEGEPCQCGGDVFFAEKYYEDGSGTKRPNNLRTFLGDSFTMNSWNATNAIHDCSPDSFEGVDPKPGKEKSCYCDPYPLLSGNMQSVKEYWRSIYAERWAKEQAARDKAEEEAAKRAAELEKKRREAEEKAAKEAELRAQKKAEAARKRAEERARRRAEAAAARALKRQ